MSALDDTEKKLLQLQDEKVKREEAIQRVLGLLDQANTKRQAEPENRKYYNDLLNRLETALDEAKANLAECHKLIDRVTARRDRLKERAEQAGPDSDSSADDADSEPQEAPHAKAPAPEPVTLKDNGEASPQRLEQAARLLAETAIESIGSITLEDVGLAQAYLAQRAEGGELSQFDHHVAVRVALAAELGNDTSDSQTVEGRRRQADLREAIDKLEQQRYHELTFGEVNLALNCYVVLSRKLTPSKEDLRILMILDKALATINDQCQRVLRKLAQVKAN